MTKKQDDNISHYPNSIDTRVALLEMSISHINDTLNRMEKKLDKMDDNIDRLSSKVDSRFYWLLTFTVAGFASLWGAIAHIAHWIN